jgi:hypothetical protein
MKKTIKFNLNLQFFIIFLFLLFTLFQINTDVALGGEASTQPVSSNPGAVVQLPNPLTGTNSSDTIPVFLGKIISAAMGILGSLALVMFIYGGITWMLSAGNPEKVKSGQQIIIWSVLGIAIIFTSYALVRFVITAISGAT